VAIDKTRLAAAYAEAGDVIAAERAIEDATRMHREIFGLESAHYAYDLIIQSQIARRRAADPMNRHLRKNLLNKALLQAEEAVAILDRQAEVTTHRHRAWTELAIVLTMSGEGTRAQQLLWRGHRAFASLGIQHEVGRIEKFLLESVFANNPSDWRESAADYDAFLRAYPDNLFARLTERVLDRIVAESARLSGPGGPIVLDLCCGTGALPCAISRWPGMDMRYIGLDCREMIEIASQQEGIAGDARFTFGELSGDWPARLAAQQLQPQIVVLGMCIFQFSPRDRQLLLRWVANVVAPDAVLLVSTSSADFECPPEAGQDSNRLNPFKATVYEIAEHGGWSMPRPLADAVAPVFAKENVASFACFLATCGFRLEPRVELIEHRRSFAEHMAFTRLKVISRKVFGTVLDDTLWDHVAKRAPEGYRDPIHGVVITARRTGSGWRLPLFFTGAWEEREGAEPVRYAAAAIVRQKDGKVLVAKRGAAVRDFPHTWSLPSAMVETGSALEESLAEGLDRNLGVTLGDLQLVALRLAPRSEDANGDWIIAMCLFEGTTNSEVSFRSPKYEEIMWVEEETMLDRLEARDAPMGDCLAAFRDLVAHRRVLKVGAP
jgi:SAM-dependent methyltransferase/ADP-ribose pyrophosphatase YjhB (NUDIX family)